jgi:hypothetical protein
MDIQITYVLTQNDESDRRSKSLIVQYKLLDRLAASD